MKSNEVLRLLKVSRPTLTKYIKEGFITGIKKENGYYDYDEDSIYKFLNRNDTRKQVIYARVSTSKQKVDLENQIQNIEDFMFKNGIKIDKVFSDISSGMNYQRNDFTKLMNDVMSYKIDTIYISYKDRFGRTAYDTIEKLFNAYGTKIIPISDIGITKSTEKEFLEEIVALIHSFSMKMYSSRRKKKLELVASDLDLESKILKI